MLCITVNCDSVSTVPELGLKLRVPGLCPRTIKCSKGTKTL